MPGRVIACVFGLSGFAVAIAAGLASGSGALRVATTACVALLVCHVVGSLVGMIAERVIEEHLSAAKAAAPKPGGAGNAR